jgi:hypothetical protein
VVRRHLRQADRRLTLQRGCRTAGARRDHIARLDKRGVFAGGVGHQRVAELDELVDVELVVGEQHEVLEVLGRGAAVVAQALQ